MKVTVLSQVLAGATAASAAACPHIQLVPFEKEFEVATLQEAQDAAADDPGFIEFITNFRSSLKANITLDVCLEDGLDVDLGIDASIGGIELSAGIELDTRQAPAQNQTVSNSTSPPTPGCQNPAVRVEWRNMKDEDKKSFVESVRCLMDKPAKGLTESATSRYEELVWAHQSQVQEIHQAGTFLPWHRMYTHLLSRLMREECGYTAPFPWWDETKDAGNFTNSPLFTKEYFGTMVDRTEDKQGRCVTDGAFAGKTLNIGPGLDNKPHCLSRGEDKEATKNVNEEYVGTCLSRTEYVDMRECIEFGPHGHGHNGVGPVMAEVSASPGDVSFFMHHSFIDRAYKIWQERKPERKKSVGGCAQVDKSSNCVATMDLETKLSSQGIRPDVSVGQVLDTQNEFLCYTYDY